MRAWIARDKYRTALFADEPLWSIDGFWSTSAINAWTYEEFRRVFPGIELPMNHKQQIELTARPVGAAEGGEG